jgi:hypothetical protein
MKKISFDANQHENANSQLICILYGDISGLFLWIFYSVFLFKNLNSQDISYMSVRDLMEKRVNICPFMFERFIGNGFLPGSLLNVAFHVTYLSQFCINTLNIRQVYTFYSNFNVSYNYYGEAYGAEIVRLGGLTQNV